MRLVTRILMRPGFLAIVSLLLVATGVEAVCPESGFSSACTSCQNLTSTTPTGSVSLINPYCSVIPWQAGTPCPTACYDRPHGRVEAHWTAGGTSRCSNGVAARDTFALDGPEGPAVSFEAVLLVQCAIVNEGSAYAAFWTAGPIQNYNVSGNYELVLPLTVVTGSHE